MKTTDSTLQALDRLVGTWTTEATHPEMPGVVVHGTVVCEWLEGRKFLIHRARTDHKDFPDAIWIFGYMDNDRVDDTTGSAEATAGPRQLCAHYFDSRGVFREMDASADDAAWRWWRNAPGFSQRFTGTFADGGATIIGQSQLCRDDVHWADDLAITYRREK